MQIKLTEALESLFNYVRLADADRENKDLYEIIQII